MFVCVGAWHVCLLFAVNQHSFVEVDYSRSFLGNSVRLYIAGVKSVLSRLASYLVTGTLDGPLVAPPAANSERGRDTATGTTSGSSRRNEGCGLGGGGPAPPVEDSTTSNIPPPCSPVSRYFTVPTAEEIREHSHIPLSRAEDLLEVLTAAKKCAAGLVFDEVKDASDDGDSAQEVTVIVLPETAQKNATNATQCKDTS